MAHLTARLRSNPVLVDAVTDTTTVLAPSTALDLAGGGTRFAVAGETTTFPGTLYNLSSSSTRYDIGITPASLFGVDGFNHPTQLRVDTDANGIPDLVIAVDSEGDGVWDQLCGAPLPCSAALYNNNGNDRPDISVGANQDVAYDLVRVIDPNQAIWKEYVTITAASFGGTSTPVTALTSSGATATATRAGHGLVVGQTVTIAGATSSGANNYNGTFVVASVPDANTFTYAMTAPSGSATAGGTISYTVRSEDSVTAQWIIATLSRASIRGLRVDPTGVVEFVTGTQQNTASFNIYETTERSREGARTLLNSVPVRSPAPDSLLPILYRIETGPVSGPYVLIEEIETTGNTLIYGPYSMENSRLRRGLERVESQMDSFGVAKGAVRVSRQSLGTAGSRRVARDQRLESIPLVTFAASAASAPSALLLETTGSGELSIPLSTLQAAGLPVTSPSALKLRRGGVRIPFALRPSASPTSLDFNAESLATDYTDRNTYTLTWDNFGTPAPTVSVTASFDPSRSGFTRIERNSIYAASAPVGTDPWQWDLLSGDGSTWPYSGFDPLAGQFDLPGLLSGSVGPVPLRLRLVGVSETQHVVRATINGVAIGEVHFEGRTPISLDTTVPAEILRETGNELNLVYDSSVRDGMPIVPGYVYLDYLEIGAPHRPAISTASLAAIRPYDARLPAVGGAKYLIVTHPDFRAEADRLAALKTAEGLKAVVLDVNVAYDRYAGGIVEPLAVRAAVQAVRAVTKFQYLVLIGDDVLDARNFLGGGTTAFIPSIMGRDNYSRIPNDNAYADLNGDGIPELAIGRLPVATPAEAAAVIDKIEAQTATLTAAANRHLFISDDQRESDAAFADNALAMSETLPASATSVFAEAGSGVGLARTTMFGAWQNGVAMTHYFGHGGPEIWTDEALFSVEDLESLEGSMPPMLLLAWACQSQFYQNYYGPTVNEALFLSPGSGSLASFGPVGITSPDHQRKLYERVYTELYKSGLSIGEIIRRAKVAALAESKANQDVVDGFMFFGDPSLRIPQP